MDRMTRTADGIFWNLAGWNAQGTGTQSVTVLYASDAVLEGPSSISCDIQHHYLIVPHDDHTPGPVVVHSHNASSLGRTQFTIPFLDRWKVCIKNEGKKPPKQHVRGHMNIRFLITSRVGQELRLRCEVPIGLTQYPLPRTSPHELSATVDMSLEQSSSLRVPVVRILEEQVASGSTPWYSHEWICSNVGTAYGELLGDLECYRCKHCDQQLGTVVDDGVCLARTMDCNS
jgi:hypothetical protein